MKGKIVFLFQLKKNIMKRNVQSYIGILLLLIASTVFAQKKYNGCALGNWKLITANGKSTTGTLSIKSNYVLNFDIDGVVDKQKFTIDGNVITIIDKNTSDQLIIKSCDGETMQFLDATKKVTYHLKRVWEKPIDEPIIVYLFINAKESFVVTSLVKELVTDGKCYVSVRDIIGYDLKTIDDVKLMILTNQMNERDVRLNNDKYFNLCNVINFW